MRLARSWRISTKNGLDPDFRLALANEFGGARSWLGTYRLVAIFRHALSMNEVQQNYHAGPALGPQPPVIVVTGAPQSAQGQPMQQQRFLPSPNDIAIDAREFKVVGEREEWIDEW